jgi:hypothetical protein
MAPRALVVAKRRWCLVLEIGVGIGALVMLSVIVGIVRSRLQRRTAQRGSLAKKLALAGRDDLDDGVAAVLACDNDPEVVRRVAEMSRNARLLATLASHSSPKVVEAIAGNLHTPKEIRIAFSKDSDLPVASKLLTSSTAGFGPTDVPEVFANLARSSDPRIAALVAGSRGVPPEVLSELTKHVDSSVVLEVAGNRDTPDDMLEALVGREDHDLAVTVARNGSASQDVLAKAVPQLTANDARALLDAVDDGSLWNPLALTLALCDHSDTEIRTRASTAYQTASKSYEKARIAAEDARQREEAEAAQLRYEAELEREFQRQLNAAASRGNNGF